MDEWEREKEREGRGRKVKGRKGRRDGLGPVLLQLKYLLIL